MDRQENNDDGLNEVDTINSSSAQNRFQHLKAAGRMAHNHQVRVRIWSRVIGVVAGGTTTTMTTTMTTASITMLAARVRRHHRRMAMVVGIIVVLMKRMMMMMMMMMMGDTSTQ
jgi:hypothetical protein